MVDPILCPYCGHAMNLMHDVMQGDLVANYWCTGCGAQSPVKRMRGDVNKEQLDACAAELARDRYTPPQEPILYDDIAKATHLLPCYIETEGRAWPGVLDKDEHGHFDYIDSRPRRIRDHYKPADYNKTWLCWATHPSDEERRSAPWCSTISAPPKP